MSSSTTVRPSAGPCELTRTGSPSIVYIRSTDSMSVGAGVIAVPLAGRLCRGVGKGGVSDSAVGTFGPFEAETRLLGGALDDEREGGGLPAETSVIGVESHVGVGVRGPAGIDLEQDPGGVLEIEHRQAPHLPVHVAWVWVVGEFDR